MLFRYDQFVRCLFICNDTVHGWVLNIGYVLFLLTIHSAETVDLTSCDWLEVIIIIHDAAIICILIDCIVVIMIEILLISSDSCWNPIPQEFSSSFLFSFCSHQKVASVSWMSLEGIINGLLLLYVLFSNLVFNELILRTIKHIKLRLRPHCTIRRIRIASDKVAFDFTFLTRFYLVFLISKFFLTRVYFTNIILLRMVPTYLIRTWKK